MASSDPNQPTDPATPAAAAPAEGPSPLEQIVEQNKSKLGITILAILLAICAFFFFRHAAHDKEAKAAAAFTSADTVEQLTAVIDQHAGTIAAGNAHLRIADLLARRDETTEALKSLQAFVDSYQNHPRHAQGIVAIGTIQQDTGDLAKAEASFQEAIARYPDADVAPLAKLRLGDIAWAQGDKDRARQLYEQIPPAHMATPYLSRIEERIRLLRQEPPSEPSERQKSLVEEEKRKREEAAEAARQAAEGTTPEQALPPGLEGLGPAPDAEIEVPDLVDPGDALMPDEPGVSLDPVEETSIPDAEEAP